MTVLLQALQRWVLDSLTTIRQLKTTSRRDVTSTLANPVTLQTIFWKGKLTVTLGLARHKSGLTMSALSLHEGF